MFDVLNRISELREERNWSVYKLAKLSNIPQSTIATWYQRNLLPPIDKLEILCDTFGISLANFFNNEASEQLTKQQLLMLDRWNLLTPCQRLAVLEILNLLLQPD